MAGKAVTEVTVESALMEAAIMAGLAVIIVKNHIDEGR